jgi:hypothetical protein
MSHVLVAFFNGHDREKYNFEVKYLIGDFDFPSFGTIYYTSPWQKQGRHLKIG